MFTEDQGKNNWPATLPKFEECLRAYYSAFTEVGNRILGLIALALGRSEDFFEHKFTRPSSLCNVNFYPSLTEKHIARGAVSLPPHSDWDIITLLVQDSVSGLQVLDRNTEEWIPVPPLPGSLVLNVGDLLARWSNDRYLSTPHRVLNVSSAERMSIPVFCNPNFDAVIDPRELGVSADISRYEPISAGEYQMLRFKELHGSASG